MKKSSKSAGERGAEEEIWVCSSRIASSMLVFCVWGVEYECHRLPFGNGGLLSCDDDGLRSGIHRLVFLVLFDLLLHFREIALFAAHSGRRHLLCPICQLSV